MSDMEAIANAFTAVNDPAQNMWDSESRNSPYCTVSGQSDEENYCEGCDSEVTYHGPDDKHGTCGCDI